MTVMFGQKLRHLRLLRGWTKSDLARHLEIAQRSHISNVEAGRRPASLQFVLRCAIIFKVATDYLLQDSIPINLVDSYLAPQASYQPELPKLFGAKLRQLRLQHNLTQSELSQQLNLGAHAHISLLENGRAAPSIDLVLCLANLFSVTTDYLLWDNVPIQECLE